jgi:hypothetical protein
VPQEQAKNIKNQASVVFVLPQCTLVGGKGNWQILAILAYIGNVFPAFGENCELPSSAARHAIETIPYLCQKKKQFQSLCQNPAPLKTQ